jgi:hypothetical protein
MSVGALPPGRDGSPSYSQNHTRQSAGSGTPDKLEVGRGLCLWAIYTAFRLDPPCSLGNGRLSRRAEDVAPYLSEPILNRDIAIHPRGEMSTIGELPLSRVVHHGFHLRLDVLCHGGEGGGVGEGSEEFGRERGGDLGFSVFFVD